METRRRFWLALLFAIPLEQLGHALASTLRGGSPLEPGGAHEYFGATLETSAAIAGCALLAGLLPIALARRACGRMPRGSAWPFLLLLTGLAALQLELYFAQEVAEGGRSLDIVARGLEGQLPVAFLGAAVLHWLSARVGPALALLSTPSLRLLVMPAAAVVGFPPATTILAGAPTRTAGARGPPDVLPMR